MFDDFEFFDFNLDKPAPEPEPVKPEMEQVDVDAIFKNLTANLEQEEEVQKAAARIIEAEAIVAQAESAYAAKKEEEKALKDEYAEIQKTLDAINQRLAKLRLDLYDVRTNVGRARKGVDEAHHATEVAKQAVVAKRKFDSQEKIFNALAQDKAWWNGIQVNGETLKILPHQWTGARYLASSERAILGDGMGLGKTLTSIAALDLVRAKRVLVVAPADVTSNFVAEIQMWAPHRSVISLKGRSKADRAMIINMVNLMDSFILVTNYESWRRDFKMLDMLIDLRLDTVILDESHNIKTTSSDAYKGVDKIVLTDNICPVCPDGVTLTINAWGKRQCPICDWSGQHFEFNGDESERLLATKSVKNLWAMTGTPILNQPADIYSPLSLIDPYNFHTRNAFLREYCWLDEYTGRWQFRSGGLESLKLRLKGRYLARNLSDTDITLPPQHPIFHEVEITEEAYPLQLRTIQQLTKYSQIVLTSGKVLNAMAVIALITRQRQANVWPGGIQIKQKDDNGIERIVFNAGEEIKESIKVDKAVELAVEAIQSGQRVAIFSQFATGLTELQSRLNGFVTERNGQDYSIRSVRFDGSTPDGVKEEIKTNFNKSRGEQAKWDIVLANYKTGGVGLNLTAATTTIILDEEWNPGKRDQAYKRTHRMGQDETTFVHVIRIPKTVDTWLSNLIEEKEDLIAGFDQSTKDMQEAMRKAIETGELSGE